MSFVKTIWRGKVGKHHFSAYDEVVRVTSVPKNEIVLYTQIQMKMRRKSHYRAHREKILLENDENCHAFSCLLRDAYPIRYSPCPIPAVKKINLDKKWYC